ncbi:MAG: hypothetical protein BAA03_02965 [Caldibacillus debilis]|nr:MAG: hypothetical protein BAA03_02965 [Caldibacillus debilis]
MDGSPHDGADFCFLWLAFLKQYINIPQYRRFPFLWPVSPEKDVPGKGKQACHAGECRFRRHTKTETGCTTSTPRLLQLKLKNWAKNIDFFMFLAYFLCFWYVHMKVYMV